jgi:DNA-directed RNA polymerase subunit M/transcription elongation factor TFIIS
MSFWFSSRNHTNERPYKCVEPDCAAKGIKSAETLTYHLLVKHGKGKPLPPEPKEGDPRFECEFCKRSYKRKSYYNRHVRIAHDKSAPIYKCQFCKYSTRQKNVLSGHVKAVHLGVTYNCKKCEKKYKKKKDLKKHYLREHADD